MCASTPISSQLLAVLLQIFTLQPRWQIIRPQTTPWCRLPSRVLHTRLPTAGSMWLDAGHLAWDEASGEYVRSSPPLSTALYRRQYRDGPH